MASDDRGGGGGGSGGGGGRGAAAASTSPARMEAPYQAALRWQLLAGLERPHAEACALLNASEACGVPRDARFADFCQPEGGHVAGSTSGLDSPGQTARW